MAVTPESRRWDSLFAQRTRGDVGEGIAAVLAFLGVPNLISFAGGFPDPLTFPRERASALLAEFAAAGEAQAFQYAPTRGLAGPLDALAGRIETLQGRRPADDELLITSGGMEALELVGKSFLDRGDVVVVEAPTYLGAIMAFRSFEAEVVAVPIDEHGLDVDELERRLVAGLRPKLLYVIPDHQNPAGVSLSGERRTALVELARRHGFLIVEDVAYRELGFERRRGAEPVEPRARRGRAGGDDVEDVLPRRAARLGRRPGGGVRAARRGEAEHRPVRGRARPAAVRGVRPPRLDRGAARAVAEALPAQVRADARRARADDARGRAVDASRGRLLLVADAAGRLSTRSTSRSGPSSRASASSRARRSSRTTGAATTCAYRSAWSRRSRSTSASSGSRRSSRPRERVAAARTAAT